MIVTVTLNPTLDKTLAVAALRPGEIHRARFLRHDIGGKGINVSRALTALGLKSLAIGFLGGATGQAMRAGLHAAGFLANFIEVAGETRQNLTLLDEGTGRYTKINEPGPFVSPGEIESLYRLVAETAVPGDDWAFCGSLPPGAPPDLYATLIGMVQSRGARAVLDSDRVALRSGMAAAPFCVKPNSEEAAEALGRTELTEPEHPDAVRALQRMGVEIVCLTRGVHGLLLGRGDALVSASPPTVEARSPVGAGDATLAGLLWSLADGSGPEEMARRAVACGTAAAMQEGTGVGDRALVNALLPQVQVTPLTD